MQDSESETDRLQERVCTAETRLRLAEAASGIGTFEVNLASGEWDCSEQVSELFGIDADQAANSFAEWERHVFVDDIPKIHTALADAKETGRFYVEFRVRLPNSGLRWLAGKGQMADTPSSLLRGAFYEITERKSLEARLLALNETLEARVMERTQQLASPSLKRRSGVSAFLLRVSLTMQSSCSIQLAT